MKRRISKRVVRWRPEGSEAVLLEALLAENHRLRLAKATAEAELQRHYNEHARIVDAYEHRLKAHLKEIKSQAVQLKGLRSALAKSRMTAAGLRALATPVKVSLQ